MISESKVRVRYAETDNMGVVYYANYFVWMEIGRTALLRESGVTYKELEAKGIGLPVTKAFAKYVAPCFYDDEVIIQAYTTQISGPRIRIDYKIMKEPDIIVCLGYTTHAFMSMTDRKVIKIPDFMEKHLIIPENAHEMMVKE